MNDLYDSNKKKIRGWKRHKRKIENWRRNVIDLDMDYVRNNQRDYAKLWIHPFYSFNRRNPPNWYNRLLLNEMIDVYLNWFEKMAEEKESFYLKIWLYEPNFINSQIVVSYKDCINYYDRTFDKNPIKKNFPIHKYKSLEDKLSLFDWEICIDMDEFWASDLKEDIDLGFKTTAEVEEIITKSYGTDKVSLDDGDDILYKVNIGDVWLGTLKKENLTQ